MTTTSELRSQLETKGEEISNIAQKIENRIEEYVDWKGMVQQRPLAAVGIAMGVGLVLSGSAGPIVKMVGKQAGLLAKGSAMAFLMGLIQSKTQTTTSHV